MPAETRTILHVDDDDAICKMVAAYLTIDGFRVLSAPDARAALRLAKSEHPDLIIADIMMPDESGYSLCRKVKGDPQTKDIPVIFLTVMEDERAALEAGALAIIAKPFKHDELRSAVLSVLPMGPDRHVPPEAADDADPLSEPATADQAQEPIPQDDAPADEVLGGEPVLRGQIADDDAGARPDDDSDEGAGDSADLVQVLLDRSVKGLKEGHLDEAMAGFQEVMDRAAGTAQATWARYYAAQIRQHQGDAERAIAEYRSILIDAPGFWRAHNRLAAIFAGAGALVKAIQHCRRSLALNLHQTDAQGRLAQLLAFEGPRKVPARRTVLCVEPDDGTRRLLADAAKGAGHRALSASNARQGLRLLFAAFPDLVVLDAALGNESGYRMCEELRNDPSAREMPVLMFNVADRASAAMAGATVMLPAPFEAARVVEAMNALLRPKAPVAAKPGGPVGKSGAPVGKPGDPRNPFGSG